MFRRETLTLNTGRYGAVVATVGDAVYVLGGAAKGGFRGDVERIRPATGDVDILDVQLKPRRFHAGAAYNGAIYLVGGDDERGQFPTTFERWDVKTGKATTLAPLPIPRHMPSVVVDKTLLYVIGGYNYETKYLAAVDVYDFARDKWISGIPLPRPRETASALLGGVIYTVGGYSGKAGGREFEAYYPMNGVWAKLPDLPFVLSANRLVSLRDKIYSFGSYDSPERVAVYDSKTRLWRPLTGTGYKPRRHTAATVGPDGALWVVGGAIGGGVPLDTIQAFRF